MSRRRAVLVSLVSASLWPVFAAYATDLAPHPQPEAQGSQQQQVQPALNPFRSASGIRPEGHAAGLRLDVETAPPPSRHDESRHGYTLLNTAIPSLGTNDFRHETAIGAVSPYSLPTNLGTGNTGVNAGGSRLKLSPVAYAPKAGWEMSGRVGPLRWLTPIDGEGETRVRFGGRLPGQPRMPGMGLLNIGIHYNFE